MKIVATSDLHGYLPENLPEGDILIIAGDITFNGRDDYTSQAGFINGKFNNWIDAMSYNYSHILMCWGNHETVAEFEPELIYLDPRVKLLHDSSVVIDGVKFWGYAWTPVFFNWGFNAKDYTRDLILQDTPEDVDVLISHGPPNEGLLGKTMRNEEAGDYVFKRHLRRINPRYCFCGHIHEGSGEHEKIGDCDVYNVSYVDFRYKPIENSWKVVEI